VFSDGRPAVASPKHYEAARCKLARLSRRVSRRQGPDRRTGHQPSNRWRKANAARGRLHYRVTNPRADAIHKLTTALAREYGTVVVEDLNVAGMLRSSRCGVVKAKLRLFERIFVCTACGLVVDRDENAAINLASLVERVVAGSGPETRNGRGADHKTRSARAGGCEASTPHRAIPAQVRRGPSPSNGRITEIVIPR